MADEQKYRFRIGAYSPKTIPLGRLLTYLRQFEKLFSNPDKIHLLSVDNGSAMPAFHVDSDYEQAFKDDAVKASKGLGNDTQNAAFKEINFLAAEDQTTATIESPDGAEIIPFPGMNRPLEKEPEIIADVKEQVTIFATPFKLGKPTPRGNQYQVWLTDLKTGDVIPKAFTSAETGIKMGAYLEQEISVNGIVQWARSEHGIWSIGRFDIIGFEPFEVRKTSETFKAISQLDHKWPDDIHEILNRLREGEK